MFELKDFIEEISKKNESIPLLNPIETEVSIFCVKLNKLYNKANEIVTTSKSSLSQKEDSFDVVMNDTKKLFIEMLQFIFNHTNLKSSFIITKNDFNEIETNLIKESLNNLLFKFLNTFDIDISNEEFKNLQQHLKEDFSFEVLLDYFDSEFYKKNHDESIKIF